MSRTNWLSVTLPDGTRDGLSEVAQYIKDNAATVFGEAGITFDPMAHGDIHMTILFIGDGLHRLKYGELEKFHTILSENIGGGKTFNLSFTGFSLFPPEKSNLVVARFTADKALYGVGENLVGATETVGLNGVRAKHNFEPHITLGKIGATKEQVQRLIKRGPIIPDPTAHVLKFQTDGFYLCGTHPPQGYFDWSINY